MPNVWFLGHVVILCLFCKKNVFQSGCFLGFFLPSIYESSNFSTSLQAFDVIILYFSHSLRKKNYLTKALTYILFQLTFSKWCWTSFPLPSVIFSKITIHAFSFSNWIVSVILVECLLSFVYFSLGDYKTRTQFLCISPSSHELLAKKNFVFNEEKY